MTLILLRGMAFSDSVLGEESAPRPRFRGRQGRPGKRKQGKRRPKVSDYFPSGAHVREEEHVADGRGVGEKHHEAVDAHAAARGRRQRVLKRRDVVGVVVHRLVVAVALPFNLRAEALGLIVRVVQFREPVRRFRVPR